MYKRFLIIKNTFNNLNLDDFFKSFFGLSINIENKDDYLIINHNLDDLDLIINSLHTLGDDLLVKIYAYNSNPLYDKDLESDIALELLNNAKPGIYNLKSLIISSDNITIKNKIFNLITNNMGIDENFISGFVDSNLNVTKASKVLYLHRNTINYKLDRLSRERDFDLRIFKDAYILYSLLDNRI